MKGLIRQFRVLMVTLGMGLAPFFAGAEAIFYQSTFNPKARGPLFSSSSPLEAPWHYQYRHLTAPQWPYAHEQTDALLVTLPNLCFDRVAKILRTPAFHLLFAKAASKPWLSKKLYESRHTSLRLRVKPMIQEQGMMVVLEHRSFSSAR